jgi:putative hydrolase of the HAD superfamily
MRAVIFGYFGTLTDPGAEEYREPLAHRTGELLGVCRPRFWEALAGSFGERTIRVHGGTESTLRAVALSCGASPSSAQLPVALAHHRSGHARLRKPRHHALGVLAELRRRGFRIGLLSDCGAELAECWSPTAFVPLVFSSGAMPLGPLAASLAATGTKMPPQRISEGAFSLVAGTGFEPATSGL